MTNRAAKEILEILAKGINPISGEQIPDQSCLNKPEVIRELFEIIGSSVQKPVLPPNQGTPWTHDLKSELAKLYSEGMPIKELASHFGRTTGAIRSELDHQGLG